MTAREEMNRLLAELTERCHDLGGRIPPHEVAWVKQKLSELNYHVNRMFAG